MKALALIAALTLSMPFHAWSQAPKAEAATPEAAKTETPKPAAKRVAARRSRRHEDARQCLERPTNTEIVKCAEEYL